jgi:hypothetical protein
MPLNMIVPHYVASTHSVKTTHAYTYSHVAQIHTSTTSAPIDIIRHYMQSAQALLAHPTTRCFTLINAGKIKDKSPDNTIRTWFFPCSYYLPRCKCLARFRLYILCLLGTTTTHKPPFLPHTNLKSSNN